MRIIATKTIAGPDGTFASGDVYEVSADIGRRLVEVFAAEPYDEVVAEWKAAAEVAKVETADAPSQNTLRRLSSMLKGKGS